MCLKSVNVRQTKSNLLCIDCMFVTEVMGHVWLWSLQYVQVEWFNLFVIFCAVSAPLHCRGHFIIFILSAFPHSSAISGLI